MKSQIQYGAFDGEKEVFLDSILDSRIHRRLKNILQYSVEWVWETNMGILGRNQKRKRCACRFSPTLPVNTRTTQEHSPRSFSHRWGVTLSNVLYIIYNNKSASSLTQGEISHKYKKLTKLLRMVWRNRWDPSLLKTSQLDWEVVWPYKRHSENG